MSGWACGIDDCTAVYGDVTDLLAHQVEEHARHECAVCGTVVPDGFFAIQHFFDAHSRADYVREYDADSDDIREREEVKERVESEIDPSELRERLGLDVAASA